MRIDAQIIKDTEGHKLVVRLVTTNEIEIAHTKVLNLGADAIDSFVLLRSPFAIEFEDADVTSNQKAIETVKKQAEEDAAKAAAEAAAQAETPVVEAEVVA